jgi:hypothetical protein
METLYYSLHNFIEEFNDYETIQLFQKNNKDQLVIVSEIERDLDNNLSVIDELNFHVEDWEEDTTYLFEIIKD